MVDAAINHTAVEVKVPEGRPSDYFGKKVFGRAAMRKYLDKRTYAALLDTMEKRKGKEFISIEEFAMCCNKLSKTHIEQLKALGAFAGMADTRQVTLF